MSKDPDLERDLERLISRIELPEQKRWVPTTASPPLQKPPWALAAAAAAVVIALAVGVASQSASDNVASRSPLISPPLLTRGPVASPPPTSSVPPRGTAVIGPAPTIVDFTDEATSAAADEDALAVVAQHSARILVIEVGRQKHTVPATRGLQLLATHGALRGDLVAYTEMELTETTSSPQKLVWHVMVANWRTGAVTKVDAVPGELSVAPHEPDYRPNAYTNGRDVIWLRTPRVNGQRGQSELVLWRDGKSTVVHRGEVDYALADDGRIAVAGMNCPPAATLRLCPGGTRWQLFLLEGDTYAPRLIATRDAQDGGGQPAFAGSTVVWPRVSGAPVKVTTVDKVDLSTGNTGTLTDLLCAWIGTTVRDVVFECADGILHMYPVSGAITRVEWNDAGRRYFVAEPHAIIGRTMDGGWVIRPVPD